jgi:hypothetical protein
VTWRKSSSEKSREPRKKSNRWASLISTIGKWTVARRVKNLEKPIADRRISADTKPQTIRRADSKINTPPFAPKPIFIDCNRGISDF